MRRGPPRCGRSRCVALAAAGGGIAITLTSDHVSEPGWQAGLLSWITLTFVLSGLVAWSRRPESRFGTLMIAAGFATSLTMLSSSDAALPFTIGQALDLLPAILFLHVFLAFPTGRLEHRAERALVAAGYVIAVAFELAGMVLGGFGPDNLLEVVSLPDAAWRVAQVQLVTVSAICLAGVGVLAARRRRSRRRRASPGRCGGAPAGAPPPR